MSPTVDNSAPANEEVLQVGLLRTLYSAIATTAAIALVAGIAVAGKNAALAAFFALLTGLLFGPTVLIYAIWRELADGGVRQSHTTKVL